MSLCDTCSNPGTCCHNFTINTRPIAADNWEAHATKIMQEVGLPFLPISFHRHDANGNPYGITDDEIGYCRYSCPKLGVDGRCTIYENRPQLCRDYKPASDALCVYFVEE